MTCPFCEIESYILENNLSYAIYDKYPVNDGHLLVIPKRHVADYFDLTMEEKNSLIELVDKAKKMLDEKYNPDGYNIGINAGEVAGQTVMHVHLHLIPRYNGDMNEPEGGVRGVIPEKQKYRKY